MYQNDVIKFTMTFLFLLAFMKPVSGFETNNYKFISLQTPLQTFSKYNTFQHFFLFKMFITPDVRLMIQQKLSHS